MDMTLTRQHIDPNGAFSIICRNDDGEQVMVTGSHAYLQADGITFAPVVGPGVFTCVLGEHAIHNPTQDDPNAVVKFMTYEITGVLGHTGCLFHWGNLPETQSEGCELTGEAFGNLSGLEAVLNSVYAFDKFMALQNGCQQFQLTVQ